MSREAVIESRFTSVICAPVYSAQHGLSSQVAVGIEDGVKHDSAIHCDELVSLPKTALTDYIGMLSDEKIVHLNRALAVAVDINSNV